MKIFNVLFLSLLIPIGIQAQSNRYYFMEGGTAITAPFDQNFHVTDDNTSTTWYEWKGSIKSIPSYYLRAGIEKQFTLCHRSQISFPISVSYVNTIQNLEMDGGWMGCVGGFFGHQSITRTSHTALIMVGIKQIINFSGKISLQNSLNFNNSLLICSEDKIRQTSAENIYEYSDSQWLKTMSASFNAQTGIFYKLNEKSKIGLVAECFFASRTPIRSLDYGIVYGAMGFGINNKNALVTTGIRLQHSF
jgi:hypothetical protein